MNFALKNVAVTVLRPEPTVMRKIFFFGSLLVGSVTAEVIVSTMVTCSPAGGRSSSAPQRVAPSVWLRG